MAQFALWSSFSNDDDPMGLSWTELRFFYDRGTGLFRRGLASLRTRGVRASWERVLKQFHTVPMEQRLALYLPQAEPFAPFAVPHSDTPVASIVIPVYNLSLIHI